MQPTDTTAIQRLIGRARLRMRGQWALEGATTATVVAAAIAAASIVAMRVEAISPTAGIGLLVGAGLIVVAGALVMALRRLDDETVARRIDRASNLSDRLSTAIAFDRTLATGKPVATEEGASEDETIALMHAAIVDGVRAVPRANVVKATPFVAPRDWRAALGFLGVSALVAGLSLPPVEYTPSLIRAEPDFAAPGEEVILYGEHLLAGVTAPRAATLPAEHTLGTPAAKAVMPQVPPEKPEGYRPEGANVYIGPVDAGSPVHVLDWTHESIRIRIPHGTPYGETLLVARVGTKTAGPLKFTVVDPKDERFHKVGVVMFDPEERAYIESVIAELEMVAKRDGISELEEFAKKIRQMLADAEEGKITKEKLLEELQKAEDALKANQEPEPEQIAKDLAQLGKDLAKEQVTKELGKALEQNDLEKAKKELEKLANKLDEKMLEQAKKELEEKLKNDKSLTEQQKQELQKQLDELKKEKPLTDKQKEQLQKQLQQAAKKMEQQQKAQEQKAQQEQQKLEEEIRRLQKQKEQAKTEKEKLDAERRLQKKQDELKQLQKKEDEKSQSAQRDAIKRLQKDIEKAAENLQKPQEQESEAEKEQRERQASQKLKDAARETGRVDQDKRKQTAQKKISSQMEELKEAMARAKQKGNKGPQDPFNKQGKNKDFAQRARGQKGQGQAWKPGQGQQPGGQGQQPGGQKWGTGHDPNLTADPTGKSGNTKDVDLQGKQGKSGTSRRETILAAAQKGFASKAYKDVYQHYKKENEEVMRNEKLPSSYKYFVKRYFAKIHPSAENTDAVGGTSLEAPKGK